MDLQDLKRWQWALIGLGAGILLGLAYRVVYTDYDPGFATLREPQLLEPLMLARDFETNRPIVRNVVVHPLENEMTRVQLVTFEIRQVYQFDGPEGPFTRSRWEPRQIWADVPFDPSGPQGNTYGDRLNALQAQGLLTGVQVREAWWMRPLPGTLLFGLIGLLLVGGVWPTLINLMLGAGLVKQKTKNDYDLDRFGGEEEASTVLAARRAMTDEEQDQLTAVNAHFAASSGDNTSDPSVNPATTTTDGQAAEGPRKLQTEKVRQTAPADEARGERDYRGEYYPVSRSGK